MATDDREVDIRSSTHRPRHAEPEPGDATTVIPRVVDGEPAPAPPAQRADETAVIPRVDAPARANADRPERTRPTPARSATPSQPAARTEPAAPSQPAGSAKPAAPAKPAGSAKPAPSARPAGPATPDAPAKPDSPPRPDATAVIPRVTDRPPSDATSSGTGDAGAPRVDWWGRPVAPTGTAGTVAPAGTVARAGTGGNDEPVDEDRTVGITLPANGTTRPANGTTRPANDTTRPANDTTADPATAVIPRVYERRPAPGANGRSGASGSGPDGTAAAGVAAGWAATASARAAAVTVGAAGAAGAAQAGAARPRSGAGTEPTRPAGTPGPDRRTTPAPRQRIAPGARSTASAPVPPKTASSVPPTSHASDSPAQASADRPVPDADGDFKPGGLTLLKDDMTTVMPVAGDPVADTTLFSAVSPPEQRPDDNEEAPAERSGSRWGPRIVALRPLRSREGYRSVHSDLTRTTTGSVIRATARTIGEVLITLGLVVLLFAAYEVWGKTAIVDAHQQTLGGELNKEWGTPAPGAPTPSKNSGMSDAGVPPGYAIARLYIPRLKKQWVVVQGVTPDDIRYAPGHYPGTAMPGQVGNFSVAGHRIPAIFWDLDQVRAGNKIVVETRTNWYVYDVSQVEIVSPHAIQAVAPVPDHPGTKPTRDDKWLTLTTCNPKWDNYQRLIVHARLVDSQPRSAGKPAALGG